MLGDMIGVETGSFIGFDNFQPLFVVLLERQIVPVQMIEDPEFHIASVVQLSIDP
jgi:hypothetical protein